MCTTYIQQYNWENPKSNKKIIHHLPIVLLCFAILLTGYKTINLSKVYWPLYFLIICFTLSSYSNSKPLISFLCKKMYFTKVQGRPHWPEHVCLKHALMMMERSRRGHGHLQKCPERSWSLARTEVPICNTAKLRTINTLWKCYAYPLNCSRTNRESHFTGITGEIP